MCYRITDILLVLSWRKTWVELIESRIITGWNCKHHCVRWCKFCQYLRIGHQQGVCAPQEFSLSFKHPLLQWTLMKTFQQQAAKFGLRWVSTQGPLRTPDLSELKGQHFLMLFLNNMIVGILQKQENCIISHYTIKTKVLFTMQNPPSFAVRIFKLLVCIFIFFMVLGGLRWLNVVMDVNFGRKTFYRDWNFKSF